MKCDFRKLPDGRCICQRCGHSTGPTHHAPDKIHRECTPGKQPPILERAATYAKAIAKWETAGRPQRPDAEVDFLFHEFCEPCEFLVNGACKKCSCSIKAVKDEAAIPFLSKSLTNKLRMGTERCPLGKWGPMSSIPDRVKLPGKLAVITCFFNPCGWRNRLDNYHRFAEAAKFQGADLHTIEAVMEGAEPSLAGPEVRTVVTMRDVLWQKERLLNLLIERLPAEYDKVAWVDCDLLFDNPKWVEDTSRLLNEIPVLQLFDEAVWLNALGVPDAPGPYRRPSIPYAVKNGVEGASMFNVSHPGFAWAARREVIRQCGGLFDRHITGWGDAIMSIGFYGFENHPWWGINSSLMRDSAASWCQAARAATGGRVGSVPGLVRHLWHGNRQDRKYDDRIFAGEIRSKFSPERDLTLDENGLWRWSSQADPKLIDFVERYFWGRNEDRKHETMPVAK